MKPARVLAFLPWFSLAMLSASPSIRAAESRPASMALAHAHNDYLHPRPLLDALDHGFGSVEADIHLVDGRLLVAHDLDKTRPDATLQSLYLDPLRVRVRRHQGRVHPDGPAGFILLIDFKTEAESTYAVLREVLDGYRDILTRYESDRTITNAVTVILSGNRPIRTLAGEPARLAAIDGRLTDLPSNPSNRLIPLISDNWRNHFAWRGEGPMPEPDRSKLADLVRQIHGQGRIARFWAVPDVPECWGELRRAKVDLINTDRLADLAGFLRPKPASP